MRIQVVSDLHLEFHNLLPPVADGVDVIVCAGDLAPIGTGAVRYAAEEWAEARHILYVLGNHEFYGTDIDRACNQLAEECYSLGIALLDSDAIVIDDVHFIGVAQRYGRTFFWMASPMSRAPIARRLAYRTSTVGSGTNKGPGGSRRTNRPGAMPRSARSSRPNSATLNATAPPQWSLLITHRHHAPSRRGSMAVP